MALTIKFDYAISSDRTKLIITDTTGAYSASNLGGWGAPNTERSAKGLYAYVTYQPYSTALETVTPITTVFDINATHANTYASVFEFTYTKDGWYRILLVALTQAEYNAVTAPETLINHVTYPNTYKEDIVLVNIVVQKNCLLEDYFECIQAVLCSKCDIIKEKAVTLDLLIQSTDYRFHSLKQLEAQRMTEQLIKQYKCCS